MNYESPLFHSLKTKGKQERGMTSLAARLLRSNLQEGQVRERRDMQDIDSI